MSVSIFFLLVGMPAIFLFIVIGKIVQWLVFRKTPYFVSNNATETSQWSDIFISLVVGMITSVAVYSIYCTIFKTVSVCLIPIIIAWFYIKYIENKEAKYLKNQTPTTDKKLLPINIFFLLLINIFWTLLLSYQFIDLDSLSLRVDLSDLDTTFYNRIAAALSVSGNENLINAESLLDKNLSNVDLYHYFELWLANFLATVLLLPIGVVTSFILIPLFLTTIVSAILALVNNYRDTIKIKHILASIVIIYAHYLYLPIYATIPKFQYMLNLCIHPFWGIKVGIYYIIGLAFIFLIQKKSYVEALLALFILPIFTITTLPAILSVSILLILWLFYKKLVSKKQTAALSITLLVVTLMLLVFPIIFPTNQVSFVSAVKISADLSYLLLKTKFNLFVGSILQTIFVFLPYVIMLILSLPHNLLKNISYQILILLVIGLLVSGAAFWTLLHPTSDSIQLLIFPAQTLITCIIYFAIIEGYFFYKDYLVSIISLKTKIRYYVMSLILIFTLSYNMQYHIKTEVKQPPFYSTKYIEQIKEIIKSKSVAKQPIFVASYMDSMTINNTYSIYRNAALMRNGGYLNYLSNICFVYSIDEAILLESPKMNKTFFKNMLFYNYMNQQSNSKIAYTQLQANFLEEHKFSFLIMSKDAEMPKEISVLVKETFVDELSGERFIVLR
jgi:hypothetical protein